MRDKVRAGHPTVLVIAGAQALPELLEFFREKCLSLSAERSYSQAAARFIQWLSVRADEFTEVTQRSLLYTAFVHDLRFGTFQDGEDAYGLYWRGTSDANVKRLSRALIEFSDWLNLRYGAAMLNPIRNEASATDQLIFWRRWNKQKASSLLAHTKSIQRAKDDSTRARRLQTPRNRNGLLADIKAFPAEQLNDLLWQGFMIPGRIKEERVWLKYHLRDILITLLCAYGGCRPSEPMHLWVDDVYIDPNDPDVALVLVHEPSTGKTEYVDPITKARRVTTRADYLQRFCNGRRPLTLETGRRHSGWKGALMTHRERGAFQVFWIDKNAGRIFLRLWRIYIEKVRPVTAQNPWAFLTKDAQPLGVEAFHDAFRSAVQRIGLTPCKSSGTSSHSLRHLYGQWIEQLGLGEKEGQIALHHVNAHSQQVYRNVSPSDVTAAIDRLSSGIALTLQEPE